MEENKKNKSKGLLIVLIILFFIICIAAITMNNKYTIQYRGNSPHEIEYRGLIVLVKTEHEIQCIKAPCNPQVGVSYKFNNSKYNKLKKELFKDKDTKELSIKSSDLTNEQIEVLSELINEEIKSSSGSSNDDSTIEFKRIRKENDSDYKEKGYKISKEDKKVVTIAMGSKNTGGYSIDVTKVKKEGETTVIYVQETKPAEGEPTTMAFTYPTVTVKLDKRTDKIKVMNRDTQEEYKELK